MKSEICSCCAELYHVRVELASALHPLDCGTFQGWNSYLLHAHVLGSVVEGKHCVQDHDHGQWQHEQGDQAWCPLRYRLYTCRECILDFIPVKILRLVQLYAERAYLNANHGQQDLLAHQFLQANNGMTRALKIWTVEPSSSSWAYLICLKQRLKCKHRNRWSLPFCFCTPLMYPASAVEMPPTVVAMLSHPKNVLSFAAQTSQEHFMAS